MQEMLPDINRLRQQLADRNLSEVARRTGIHRNALYRFAAGETMPRYATLAALWRYLKGEGNG